MKTMALRLNKKAYYGWVIVVVSALALAFSAPGQTYSISIFINIYETELGYSKTMLSTGYSIATTASGLLLIFMGKLTDRFGQRTMMIIVVILLALTTFYNSFIMNIYMVFVGFFLLRYFGQGSMTLIPNSLVPQWFEKRRAFAISLSGFGNLLSTLIVPVFNVWLIHNLEWQNAWRFWGVALLIVFLPIVIIFVINRPEDIGLKMENDTDGPEDVEASLRHMEMTSWTLKEALHTKEFWFVGLMSLVVPMFSTGITFHWIEMMAMRNVGRTEAAIIVGLLALPFAVMPFIARAVIDRFPVKNVFMVTLSMILASMGWLLYFVEGAPTAIMFVLFYGFAVSVQAVALNTLWPNYFGRKYLGSIRGASTVFMVIGSALGPLPFGVVFDRVGSFNPVIIGMMIMTVAAIFLAFLIKKPEKKYK